MHIELLRDEVSSCYFEVEQARKARDLAWLADAQRALSEAIKELKEAEDAEDETL